MDIVMARETMTKTLRQANIVNTATSNSACSTLRAVGQCAEDNSANTIKIVDLVELCNEAADHLSAANKLLYACPSDAEDSIGKLDAALGCLKKVTLKSSKTTEDAISESAQSA